MVSHFPLMNFEHWVGHDTDACNVNQQRAAQTPSRTAKGSSDFHNYVFAIRGITTKKAPTVLGRGFAAKARRGYFTASDTHEQMNQFAKFLRHSVEINCYQCHYHGPSPRPITSKEMTRRAGTVVLACPAGSYPAVSRVAVHLTGGRRRVPATTTGERSRPHPGAVHPRFSLCKQRPYWYRRVP
jgi:hypothetical protein